MQISRASMLAVGGIAIATVVACAGTPAAVPQRASVTAQCPQARTTTRAPDAYWSRANPLPRTTGNLLRGQRLFEHDARPEACADCHGASGNGTGHDAAGLDPPPRNFTCAATMAGLTDGQLYWVIENGSGKYHRPTRQEAQRVERPARGEPTSAMRAYGDRLSPTEIWQLVMYIRSLEHGTG